MYTDHVTMAGVQAKAVYEFESAGDGELSMGMNEVFTILRQDVGDGWWEAQNSRGQVGLVPEAYLEIISVPEPNFPPPPPPAPVPTRSSWNPQPVSAASRVLDTQRSMSQRSPISPTQPQSFFPSAGAASNRQSAAAQPQWQAPVPSVPSAALDLQSTKTEHYEDWDDEWSDEDSSTTTETPDLGSTGGSGGGKKKEKDTDKFGTVKARPFSKYSNFTKSGGEAYLFAPSQAVVPAEEFKPCIVETSDGPMWQPAESPFSCVISSPKKETKFKGIKAFIAYQLTPSFSKIQVSRRYKHFDWLHERLESKFSTICVPPLPDKQVAGRFEEDFVAERMRQLQLWIDRLCRHPVLYRADVFHHFLSCTEQEKKWKAGKRKAEKDEFQGGQWFFTVNCPNSRLDSTDTEIKLDHFAKYVKNMDDSVRHLLTVSEGMAKRHHGPFKKEFAKLGGSFVALARSFEFDERPDARPLTEAVEHTGRTYEEIGDLFQRQPRNDLYLLMEGLYEYKRILSTFPDVLNVYRAACAKIHENAGRLDGPEIQAVQDRADVIAYCTMAEMQHFNSNRVVDYNAYMQGFLREQIGFYKEITSKLESTLQKYDGA